MPLWFSACKQRAYICLFTYFLKGNFNVETYFLLLLELKANLDTWCDYKETDFPECLELECSLHQFIDVVGWAKGPTWGCKSVMAVGTRSLLSLCYSNKINTLALHKNSDKNTETFFHLFITFGPLRNIYHQIHQYSVKIYSRFWEAYGSQTTLLLISKTLLRVYQKGRLWSMGCWALRFWVSIIVEQFQRDELNSCCFPSGMG